MSDQPFRDRVRERDLDNFLVEELHASAGFRDWFVGNVAPAFAAPAGLDSVSKITTGYPYNDFTVTNEPVRGDIYLSVPEGFAPGRLSFFATSRKGYVYKFACSVGGPEAEQIFVSNPAIAGERAQAWEAKSSPRDAAVRLVQAMAANSAPDGYTMRQVAAAPTRVGDLTVRLIAEFRGAALTGRVLRIDNRSAKPVTIDSAQLTPAGSFAVSVADRELAPHGATTLYVVQDGSAGA